MRFIIVTGMSGAGKSSVLRMLEDTGYFCVDNLPVQLIKKFAMLTFDEAENIDKVALGIDIRNGEALEDMQSVLNELSLNGYNYEILFLDASDNVLIKRFKETRRNHPLAISGRIDKGIKLEREKLDYLKKSADYIIDTSRMLIRELKAQVYKIFVNGEEYNNFFVTIVSFGFKYGIPVDADLVFDVRFLPNPFYIDELKEKTGNDKEVYDYVMSFEASNIFLEKLTDMVKFLIPKYIEEGKNQLVIAIGCTGGKHRSVTLANALYNNINKLSYGFKIEHRDAER